MAIELALGEKVKAGTGKAFYMAKLSFMHGDADATTYEDYTFTTEEMLVRFLEVVEAIGRLSWGKSRDAEARRSVEGYEEFFGDEWPWDVTTDYSHQAALYGYEVTYTAENGDVYKVVVIEKE
jgi:hypothetical protein